LATVQICRLKHPKQLFICGEKVKKEVLTVTTLGLLLVAFACAGLVWLSPRVLAIGSSAGETVDTGVEYSNGTIGSTIDGLAIWYVWINTNHTQVIYLAYVSTKYPPSVMTFFGQHYTTGNGTEVFVGNTLTAMEVYNDTNQNGVPDVGSGNDTNELLYNFAVNSSQSFLITTVQKTLIGGVPHYTWGLQYNTLDGFLLTANQATSASVIVDYLATSYDFYLQSNVSYLKTSFKIGKITNVTSTSDHEVTLEGLSLSLLYGTSILASKAYTMIVNGEPYNSTTAENSAELTKSGEIRVEDWKAYECVFGQNYTLSRGSTNVTYPSISAAVSDTSVPGGLYRSIENTLPFFEDVLASVFPRISGMPPAINLDYNVSSFLYRICYPQWSGYPLEHDPTYVAYLTTFTMPGTSTPVAFIVGITVIGSIALMVALLDTKRTLKTKLTRASSHRYENMHQS
jgi:hypothetical protein